MQPATPLLHPGTDVSFMMRSVLWALLPGILVSLWFLGLGLAANLAATVLAGLVFDRLGLWLRGQSVVSKPDVYSTLISAVIVALILPVSSPWWLPAGAMLCAILLFKHAFGGLGQNPFNPAMAACLLALPAFPDHSMQINYAELSRFFTAGSWQQWQAQLLTPAASTLWINISFLIGGVYLAGRAIITWTIPLALLASLALIAWLWPDAAGGRGTPVLHWFSGATMLAAFFITTDPASSPDTVLGRLLYGLLLGTAIYLLRSYSSFDNAPVLAVIFANFCAPLLDLLGRPRIYGHDKAKVLPDNEDIAYE